MWPSLRPRCAIRDDEAAEREALLHLVEALLAEVAHPQKLIVAERQELPDLGDVVPLQAVVGTHRQVELLDRRVEEVGAYQGRHVLGAGQRPSTDLGKAAELLYQDLGGTRQRCLGGRRPIGLDLEVQAVEVRHLTHPRIADDEVHAAHRGEDGVHRDDPDRQILGVLGRSVADARLHGEVHLDRSRIRVEGQQEELRVDDLDVGRLGDVGGGHRTCAMLHQLERDRVARERAQAQLLDVEDDLGHVLLDIVDRAEFVEDTRHLHRCDGGPLQRIQKDAAQGIAERHPVAIGQRVDLEDGQVAARFDLLDAGGRRGLKFDHEGV